MPGRVPFGVGAGLDVRLDVILEWVSFRARCLLGLDADLDSSFSFDLCIIGGGLTGCRYPLI